MKKYVFFLLFAILFIVNSYSQSLPIISDDIRVSVDTTKLRLSLAKMKKSGPLIYRKQIASLTQDDLDKMHAINFLYIYADTINNEIKSKVDSTSFLIFLPSKKVFYIWSSETGYFAPIDYAQQEHFHSLVKGRLSDNYDCAFCVTFFPLDKARYYILSFKDKDSDNYIYMDAYYRTSYPSLSYLLGYYFGSPASYIEAYKNRLRYRSDFYIFKSPYNN